MPRNGSTTFGDLDGKLDRLRVECTRCGRKGSYSVARLLRTWGPDGRLMDWKATLAPECPRTLAKQVAERPGVAVAMLDFCRIITLDLPSVLLPPGEPSSRSQRKR